jgi:hypothetical protein
MMMMMLCGKKYTELCRLNFIKPHEDNNRKRGPNHRCHADDVQVNDISDVKLENVLTTNLREDC